MFPGEASQVRLTWPGRTVCGLAGIALVAVFATATRVDPDRRGFGTHEQLGLPPCGFHLVFNIPCPSCGATTSFAHFVRGHWRSAVRSNAGAFALALISALAAPWFLAGAAFGRLAFVQDTFPLFAGVGIAVALVTLVHWLVRIAGSLAVLTG